MARYKSITETGPKALRGVRNPDLYPVENNPIDLNMSQEDLQQLSDMHNRITLRDYNSAHGHIGYNVFSDPATFTPQRVPELEDSDYGQSFWDESMLWGNANQIDIQNTRAENQPWYSKLVNGIGKAGVLAGTTALETAGLLYGIGQGIYNAANAENGKGVEAFLHGLWDNPITNALQKINEASEEYMPNYYTQDEQENPFGNIFTANFLGDKILKNLGFMVGAFYGGIPASSLMGKVGVSAVKNARNAALAERAGMARRVGELTSKYGDDAVGLERALATEGLTEAERGKKILEGFDKVRDVAQTTRATTQTIGALGSAINEGAIEALNNSKDWAKLATQQEDARYQQEVTAAMSEIEQALGGTEMMEPVMAAKRVELAQKHDKQLAEIEKGRARMGNADLLLNIPVLMASNMYQLGKLYTRGFDATRREMGSLWNGHKLSGDLAKGTLKSDKTWKGALGTALLKSNTEGLEEYLQRAASDGAGEAVNESIRRFMEAGQNKEAENEVQDYIAGFGKAVAENLSDPNAWEEYMIGAVSSMVGMPVFGSQTKNAYLKLGPVGFAGGIKGNYDEYMEAKKHEEEVANYLNRRVKDPKFKAHYDNLKKQKDYNDWLMQAIVDGDKMKYKDLEQEGFFQDLNAAASSGHLEEFKQLVGYNTEYSDEELEDIVKQTTTVVSPEQQKKQDENRKAYLEGAIQTSRARNEDSLVLDYQKELDEVNKRLQENNYQEKQEGPFIDVNGQMNVTNPDKMREILERNRQNLLQGIDDYLKIRNDIDIETDGKLDDDQLSLLTLMKGKILDHDRRSAEMADDLISNLGDVLNEQEKWQEKIKQDLQKAQEEYDGAKEHWEKVKKGPHNQEWKNKVEKKFLAAEKKLQRAKTAERGVGNIIKLLQLLTEEKETTGDERAANAKGYGEDIVGRAKARLDSGTMRAINSDEAQAILANPQNAIALVSLLNSSTSSLDAKTRERLTQEVIDLTSLANQKIEYNKKLREFIGDPDSINEAYQQAQDKISQQEKDNKADELALNIKNAANMAELDRIMRDAYNVNSEIVKAALEKAKQTADDTTKKFIADYEQAIDFYGNVVMQAQKLPQAVGAGVVGTAASEWENALQEGVDVYDKFIEGMNEAAIALENSGAPGAKETAEGIRKVLSDLDAAKRSVATNKNVKTSTDKKTNAVEGGESSDQEKQGLAALNAKLAEKRAGKAGNNALPADTKETLQNAAEKEVRNSKDKKGSYSIDDTSKLSKELQDRIQKYNEEHPDEKVSIDFEELFQRLTDEAIAADNGNLGNDDLGNDGSDLGGDENDRAERMHENLTVTFRSDKPTEFNIFDGRNLLDYRDPYKPDTAQLQAVQKLLQELKAYNFVDKNFLGYVARKAEDVGKPVTIHLLRSTDDAINSDPTNPITFLAIKWDDSIEATIREYGYGGNKNINLSEEIRPVSINGEQYHIVGVMSLNGTVSPDVSKAFASLQGALNKELTPQIEEAKEAGQPFVVSTLTTVVDTINTGRLDKRNNGEDEGTKVGLYDFMTSKQGDNTRKTSSEWENGMDFYFGIVVNDFLNIPQDDKFNRLVAPLIEYPNDDGWMKKNNGAIIMFVPKADGRLYPVRVIRRTVTNWLDNIVDGSHTGSQLLEAVMAGEETNEYLGNIINYLRTLFDEDATIGDKMSAKIMLQKYFILGKQSPIHFNDGEVTLQFENREHDITGDTFEEFVTSFFDALAGENIMFSLPTNSIESINGRNIVKSGAFEIRLRGFYNFNANFTIKPIDGEGHPVVVEAKNDGDDHFTGGKNNRAQEMKLNLGDGMKTYIIQGDGTVTYNGNPVSTDKQNIVTAVLKAQQGQLPQFKLTELGKRFNKSSEAKKFVSDGVSGFDGIYIIHAEDDWVYDSRKANHDERLYKLNSAEGKNLMEAFNQAVADFIQDNLEQIKKLKERKPSSPEQPSSPTAAEARETLSNVGKQMQDALNGSSDLDEMNALLELGRAAIEEAKNAGIEKSFIKNISAIHKGLQTKANNYKKAGIGNPPSGENNAHIFAGKQLSDLDEKEGGLIQLLSIHRKSPIAQKVFDALQGAEEAGIPIDQRKVAESLNAIFKADKDEKRKLLNDLLNELNGCNK